jgi:predicted nucleic acid-binding protein
MESTPLTLLLDSVILIDHFNGVAQATEYLGKWRKVAAISVITRAEVLTGFVASDEHLALKLLDALPTLAINAPVADLAARLRREQRWKLPDAFQAALAMHHNLRLVTRNIRDFPPGRYPFVAVPYQR